MARHVGRSRGCKSCLQRKIKCDENVPQCTQCAYRGQKCPGAVVGAVFVTMKPNAKKEAATKEKGSSSQRVPSLSYGDTRSGHERCTSKKKREVSSDGSQLQAGTSCQCLLPTSYQPSRTTPFEQLFVGHFISSSDSRNLHRTQMRSWYEELPTIVSSSRYRPAIDSIRAATMIHYGVMTANESIQAEAFKWYAKALEGQGAFLQQDKLLRLSTASIGVEILSSIILSLFEVVSSTTPTGWMDHILGAASMLESRRPENCQNGLVHLLFRTIRMTVVYVTMSREEQHIFASEPWITVPFAIHLKNMMDRLIDILLSIPSCLSLYNHIKRISGVDIQEEQRLLLELQLKAASQLQLLHEWWQEYAETLPRQSGKNASLPGRSGRAKDPYKSQEPYFSDAFTAACTASYHAACLIIYTMLSFTSPRQHVYDTAMNSHTGHILAASSYLIANGTCSAGRLMMIFPLKITWRWALDGLDRQSAFSMLEEWGQKHGIIGVCTQSLPLYEIPTIYGKMSSSPRL